MDYKKEQFLKKMELVKQDLEEFKMIDFSNFDKIDREEYSKVITTLENMLERSDAHREDIISLFSDFDENKKNSVITKLGYL